MSAQAFRPPPRAPWGQFPLSELTVFAALVIAGLAFASWGQTSGAAYAGSATVLACCAGLEIAVRDHLAGLRSHSLLIAGSAAVLGSAALLVLALPLSVIGGAFGAVLAAGTLLIRRDFTRRNRTKRARRNAYELGLAEDS